MLSTTRTHLLLGLGLALLIASDANAGGPGKGSQFDTSDEGWELHPSAAAAGATAGWASNGATSFLRLHDAPNADLIVTAPGVYYGDWGCLKILEFSVRDHVAPPSLVRVELAGGGHAATHVFAETGRDADGWRRYAVQIEHAAGWTGIGAADWPDLIESVTSLVLTVEHDGRDNEIVDIDEVHVRVGDNERFVTFEDGTTRAYLNEYATLQETFDSLDWAGPVPRHHLWLAPGTHADHATATLRGDVIMRPARPACGGPPTTLMPDVAGRPILALAGGTTASFPELRVSDVSFSGGVASGDGGALDLVDIDLVSLERCGFFGCIAQGRGGAVSIQHSLTSAASYRHVNIYRCEFEQNYAASHGGAVSVRGARDVRVDTSVFRANVSEGGHGGALSVRDSESVHFSSGAMPTFDEAADLANAGLLRFEGNEAVAGGAIAIAGLRYAGSSELTRAIFVGNHANRALAWDQRGGALYVRDVGRSGIQAHQSAFNVTSCLFARNQTTGLGGGLAIERSNGMLLQQNVYRGNRAGSGGAVAVEGVFLQAIQHAEHDVTLLGETIGADDENALPDTYNAATELGGGVFVRDALVRIASDPEWWAPDPPMQALIGANRAATGGGVAVTGSASRVGIEGARIVHNRAAGDGGGIAAFDAAPFDDDDGVTNRLIVESTTLHHNLAGSTARGGGLSLRNLVGAVVEDTTATQNSALEGGAVSVMGCRRIGFSLIEADGNGARSRGGAVFVQKSPDVYFSSSRFADNVAGDGSLPGRGGALFAEDTLALAVTTGRFIGNEARGAGANGSSGGAVALVIGDDDILDAPMFFSGNSYEQNSATNGGAISVRGEAWAGERRDSVSFSDEVIGPDNTAEEFGGGLDLVTTRASLFRCTITDNHARIGGGVAGRGTADDDPPSSGGDGGLAAEIADRLFTNRLRPISWSSATLDRCELLSNTASLGGGGIATLAAVPMQPGGYLSDDEILRGGMQVTALDATIDGNVVDAGGWVSPLEDHLHGGGGVLLTGRGSALSTFDRCTVRGNRSDGRGGGYHVAGMATLTVRNTVEGGASIVAGLIERNEAVGPGGGIAATGGASVRLDGTSDVLAPGPLVWDNVSNDAGGGLSLGSRARVRLNDQVRIMENHVRNSLIGGGGIHVAGGRLTSEGFVRIAENFVEGVGDGGGILIDGRPRQLDIPWSLDSATPESAAVVLSPGVEIHGNTLTPGAGGHGGGVAVIGGADEDGELTPGARPVKLDLEGVVITDNEASGAAGSAWLSTMGYNGQVTSGVMLAGLDSASAARLRDVVITQHLGAGLTVVDSLSGLVLDPVGSVDPDLLASAFVRIEGGVFEANDVGAHVSQDAAALVWQTKFQAHSIAGLIRSNSSIADPTPTVVLGGVISTNRHGAAVHGGPLIIGASIGPSNLSGLIGEVRRFGPLLEAITTLLGGGDSTLFIDNAVNGLHVAYGPASYLNPGMAPAVVARASFTRTTHPDPGVPPAREGIEVLATAMPSTGTWVPVLVYDTRFEGFGPVPHPLAPVPCPPTFAIGVHHQLGATCTEVGALNSPNCNDPALVLAVQCDWGAACSGDANVWREAPCPPTYTSLNCPAITEAVDELL